MRSEEIVHAHGLETENDAPIRSVLALLAKLKLPIHKTKLDLSVPMTTLTGNMVHSLPFTVVPRLSLRIASALAD